MSHEAVEVEAGRLLVDADIRIVDLVASWAKNERVGINKMEFRQNIRRLLEQGGGQRPNVKEVDKLFESLDEDGGGALDVTEVRGMLRKLKEAASDRLRESGEVKEAAAMYRARAGQAKDVANATRASEQADKRLDELKGKKSLDARLGEVLVQKAVKIGEIVNKWGGHPDDGGDGQLS